MGELYSIYSKLGQDSVTQGAYYFQLSLAMEPFRTHQASGRWQLDLSGGIKTGFIVDHADDCSRRFSVEKASWDTKER